MAGARRAGRELPSWLGNLGDEFYDLPLWVGRTGHCRLQCEADLPPHVVWTALLEFSRLPFGPRSIARVLATFCGGKAKTKAQGFVRGSRLHCWPKAADIGQRAGLSERRVLDHLRALEDAGWIHVERPTRRGPSDYWLTLPEADRCPCGCEEGHPTCAECDEALDEIDRDADADVCFACSRSSSPARSPDASSPLSPDESSGQDIPPSLPDRGARGYPSPDDLSPSPDDLAASPDESSSSVLTNRHTHWVQSLDSVTADFTTAARRAATEDADEVQDPGTDPGRQEPEPRAPTKAEELEALPVEERLADLERRLRENPFFTDEQIAAQLDASRRQWTEAA